MEIIKASNDQKLSIISFLKEINYDLPIPLTKKVNIKEYAYKLLHYGIVFVAKDNDEICGLIGGYCNNIKSGTAFISILAVSRNCRSFGYGSLLIERFSSEALCSRMRSVKVPTHETNTNAIRFYLKNGFNEIDRTRDNSIMFGKVIVGINNERPNILLTSVGRRAYLVKWFKDALGNNGEVHVVNNDSMSPAFAVADKATTCPLIYSDEYIPFLLDYCKTNKIGAICPLFDIDIPVLAKHKKDFMKIGTFTIVAELPEATICNDKYKTYEALKAKGLNVVPSYVSLDDCHKAINKGEICFPIIVKPRWGMGSIGVYIVETPDELNYFYEYTKKQILKSYLKYESIQDIDEAVLLQQVMDGQEYGMDVINNLSGDFCSLVVRKKLAMRSGETDVAEVIKADERFNELGYSLSRLIRQPGNMDVDVFDVDGKLYVLEMNPRFGGGYPFSHLSGVNLPHAFISWLKGEDVDKDILVSSNYDTYLKDIAFAKLQ